MLLVRWQLLSQDDDDDDDNRTRRSDQARGETRNDARRALHDLLEQKRASPICIIDILPSNTVEEEVVHPDLPCVGRVWHALAHPFFRYLYDEWLEEGGRLIQEVVPLTRGVLFREGILRLAPQELAAIDCEWEWARRNPFSWPPAVAYLADEAGCAAILITRVHDPAQFERLRHATPVRQTTSESPDESAIRVAYVLQSAPLMLEAALVRLLLTIMSPVAVFFAFLAAFFFLAMGASPLARERAFEFDLLGFLG